MKKIFIILFLFSTAYGQTLIPLTSNNLYDTYGAKTPANLLDGNTSTVAILDYSNGFIMGFVGVEAWIDLKNYYNVFKLEGFNNGFSGQGYAMQFQFYYSRDTSTRKSAAFTYITTNDWTWSDTTLTKAVTDSMRFMRIKIPDINAQSFSEFRLYGVDLGVAPSILPAYAAPPADPGRDYQGVGIVQIDSASHPAAWSFRLQEYKEYVDTTAAATTNSPLHTYVWNKFQNSKTTLVDYIIARGQKVHPYYQGAGKGFQWVNDFDSKDIPRNADSSLLASWPNVGHGLVSSITNFTETNFPEIENGNEDDKWWKSNIGYHHQIIRLTKLKAGWDSVKAVYPNVKVISGALIGLDTAYLRGMFFLNYLKNQDYPADIIGFNHYSTTSGGQGGSNTDGVSPEQDRLLQRMQQMVYFRDTYHPGKPLYHTEWGYDSLNSLYNVPDISGVADRGITKANWGIRVLEIDAAARIDKSIQYTARDIGGGDFGTTGLEDIYEDPPGIYTLRHKRLYFYMATRQKLIDGWNAWPTIVANGDSTGVWLLKYTKPSSDSAMYSVWNGTNNNSTTSNYDITVGSVTGTPVRTTLTQNDADGVQSNETVNSGIITVASVTETPAYIKVLQAAAGDPVIYPATIHLRFRVKT